jgi:DNA adenine methylase
VSQTSRPLRPPLKLQGGKTRLLPFLRANIEWSGTGRWVEPFFGAGAVALNFAHPRALVADANPHLVAFHHALADGSLTGDVAVDHLDHEGAQLRLRGPDQYYEARERFNSYQRPEDLLFLNHAGFNGLMRFNSKGGFNTPYGHDAEHFTASLLSDLKRRVDSAAALLARGSWAVECADWRETLAGVKPNDFVYMDPPYAGRYAGYFNSWDADDARALATTLSELQAPWALSDWWADANGPNPLIRELYGDRRVVLRDHRYVIGAKASSRGRVVEALVLSD